MPSTGGTLFYWYRISSSDSCGYDYGYVRANTTTLKTYNLCLEHGIDELDARFGQSGSLYTGPTITIRFRATTDSSLVSSFYIDDVRVSTALQGVIDPNGMDGERLTRPAEAGFAVGSN